MYCMDNVTSVILLIDCDRLLHLSQLWSSTPCQPPLSSNCLFVWNLKFHRTLTPVVPSTLGDLSHWDGGTSKRYVVHMYTIPATWLCLSLFTVPACIMYPATKRRTVFGVPLHCLKLGLPVVDLYLYGSGVYGLFLYWHDHMLFIVIVPGQCTCHFTIFGAIGQALNLGQSMHAETITWSDPQCYPQPTLEYE